MSLAVTPLEASKGTLLFSFQSMLRSVVYQKYPLVCYTVKENYIGSSVSEIFGTDRQTNRQNFLLYHKDFYLTNMKHFLYMPTWGSDRTFKNFAHILLINLNVCAEGIKKQKFN